jgi:hypothetical protein
VEAGEVMGELRFTQDGQDLGAVNLIAARSLAKANLPMILAHWRDMWPPGIALERWGQTTPRRS